MESIDILIDYFSLFKLCEINSGNNKKETKNLEQIIEVLKNTKSRTGKVQYLNDFNYIENIVKKYDLNSVIEDYLKNEYNIEISEVDNTDKSKLVKNIKKGIDNVLYDVFLNVNRYNQYLMNKKIKTQNIPINTNISFDSLDVKLKDVLSYLEIKDEDLDKDLISDLSNFVSLDRFKELATVIKTDNGMKRVLFDKIEDKNVLVSILLHSNLELIDSIVDIFESEHANINKVVCNIPSIFIKNLISSKCKYNDILTNYDNFIKNYKYLKSNDIEFKKILNFPVYFINDFDKNKSILDKLDILMEGEK